MRENPPFRDANDWLMDDYYAHPLQIWPGTFVKHVRVHRKQAYRRLYVSWGNNTRCAVDVR